MNTNTDFDKIDKVLSKITGKELKSFVRVYSYPHDDFATALVEKYWKPERGNYNGGGLLPVWKPCHFVWRMMKGYV